MSPSTRTGLTYWPPAPVVLEGPVTAYAPVGARVRMAPLTVEPPPGTEVMPGRPARPAPAVETEPGAALAARSWRDAAEDWRGTPYLLGGDDRSGIDCSAFTRRIHRDVAGNDLPRTTGEQASVGVPIPAGVLLQPGDLVFFQDRPGEGALSHVGVMVGDREFAHAASSTGVTVSRLDQPYWRDRWVGSRRVR